MTVFFVSLNPLGVAAGFNMIDRIVSMLLSADIRVAGCMPSLDDIQLPEGFEKSAEFKSAAAMIDLIWLYNEHGNDLFDGQ